MKSFIHSLSKLVWIQRGFFIRTSFDRLWMEIFPFLFLILKGFCKGFQMRYHLFFNSNGKAVKTIKIFSWKSAMWYIMSMSVCIWMAPYLLTLSADKYCESLSLDNFFFHLYNDSEPQSQKCNVRVSQPLFIFESSSKRWPKPINRPYTKVS